MPDGDDGNIGFFSGLELPPGYKQNEQEFLKSRAEVQQPKQTSIGVEHGVINGTLVRKLPPFPSRALVIASCDMLKVLGHSGFDALLLRWDLPNGIGDGSGLAARSTSLAKYALSDPELRTSEGHPLQSEIVYEAGEIYRAGWITNIGDKERNAFKKASDAAGSMNDVSESGTLVYGTNDVQNAAVNVPGPAKPKSNKVFIVHGHDEGALEKLARFLEKVGLGIIILKEQPNQGRTIIEKYEDCADEVGFAVVLLTPDDVGSAAAASGQAQRARQNVIFELGYFAGKLGRGRVCLLRKEKVEMPSDLFGVVYTDMDLSDGWKMALVKELKAAGLAFDPNRLWD
ncbi:nucleotide-binding protein [Rhizobium sp. CCGE 510]|uniref:TIR domain-containing protein n=1 Tax=Rhizobium sp. CCGE 510 TaxID=1132836 RepID=UPI0002E8D408|nr:nucleotide-binding protein [Rhizobium sp. CCGE 510]